MGFSGPPTSFSLLSGVLESRLRRLPVVGFLGSPTSLSLLTGILESRLRRLPVVGFLGSPKLAPPMTRRAEKPPRLWFTNYSLCCKKSSELSCEPLSFRFMQYNRKGTVFILEKGRRLPGGPQNSSRLLALNYSWPLTTRCAAKILVSRVLSWKTAAGHPAGHKMPHDLNYLWCSKNIFLVSHQREIIVSDETGSNFQELS